MSVDHKNAVQDCKVKKDMGTIISKIQHKSQDFLISCLKSALFIAVNEMSNTNFGKLQDFVAVQGCSNISSTNSVQYRHSESVNDLHEAIATVIKDELLSDINKSNVVSIICDETCDNANIKHLGVDIRYVKDGLINVKFLDNVEINDGTANTLMGHIKKILGKNSIPINKVVALGCDGANVMLGRKNGLIAHMKREHSYVIAVHCAAHRLALVLQHSTKDVQCIKSYNETLKSIFIFFNGSAVRCSRLKEIQKLMESPELKYVELHTVRWLSMQNAVRIIFNTLDALITFLESEVCAGRDTIARGLLKAVKNGRFIYISHTLMDILPIFGILSKIFQKDVSDFSMIKPCVQKTLNNLNCLKNNTGKTENLFFKKFLDFDNSESGDTLDLDDDILPNSNYYSTLRDNLKSTIKTSKSELQQIKVNLINSMTLGMKRRFSDETLDILECFSAYDPTAAKIAGVEKSKEYVKRLMDHFKDITPLKEILNEYDDIFCLMTNSYSMLKFANVAEIFISKYKELYASTALIYEIGLVIPISSASTERSFSTQNRIKNKFRCRLGETTLSNLIRISEANVAIESFEYEKAATIFNNKVKRRYLLD